MLPIRLVNLAFALLLLGTAALIAAPPDSADKIDQKQEEEAKKAFDSIYEKMNEAQDAYYKPFIDAREKGLSPEEMDKIELDPELEPVKIVGPEMLRGIEKFAGTEAALQACDRLMGMAGRRDTQGWMVEKVVTVMKAQ